MRFLIVGAESMIGSELIKELRSSNEDVIGTTRHQERVNDTTVFLDLEKPILESLPEVDVVYLCAARCLISDCEQNSNDTRLVNVTNTVVLANYYSSRGAFVVFISTALVFDGAQDKPEIDTQVNPLNEYGKQKADAEKAILALAENSAIVRLTKVLSSEDQRLTEWINDIQQGKTIRPFNDLMFTPIALDEVCSYLIKIGMMRLSGISHLANDTEISYAEAITTIGSKLHMSREFITPCKMSDKVQIVDKQQSNLSMNKTRQRLEVKFRSIQDTLMYSVSKSLKAEGV